MKRLVRLNALCAVLVVQSLALAQQPPAPPAQPAHEVEITQEAREHFSAGVSFMQDPDGARYEEAYREFRRAYELSPSWKILGNLGIAALRLERDGEAIEAFRKYLAEGGAAIDAAERQQFTRDLATLESSVVQLKLTVPVGASVVDQRMPPTGSPITTRYSAPTGTLDIGVRPGHHRITVRLDGYEDAIWEVDFDPRQVVRHSIELKKPATASTAPVAVLGPTAAVPADASSRPVPTSVYVGLAATGALAAGGVVVGILASNKRSEFDELNSNLKSEGDVQDARELRDSGKTLNLVADGLFGGAIVAGGITAVLYFTRPTVQSSAVRFTPVVQARGGGLSLSGSF